MVHSSLQKNSGSTWQRTELRTYIHCASYHPDSNGLAECFVKMFKTAMHVAQQEGIPQELHLLNFLLIYRSTPHATTNCTAS